MILRANTCLAVEDRVYVAHNSHCGTNPSNHLQSRIPTAFRPTRQPEASLSRLHDVLDRLE
ncbi:hypothetical protein T4E_630 [Trichinella pseudospiralis]|uniref:Uncharacterized protein n=1 Tax=Trichinella pseudospiralis TaxID=6337 RepID=A0A0V0YND0_TRIPS|nr:hypothetical protein T4E_630 [Trichinella pseudospiralis]